jgi:hypothetical protein
MSIDVSHLVLEALRDTDDQVLDDGLDRPKGSDVLPRSMVYFDFNHIGLRMLEADGDVLQVLSQFASGAFNVNDPGFDCDLDCKNLLTYSSTRRAIAIAKPLRLEQSSTSQLHLQGETYHPQG